MKNYKIIAVIDATFAVAKRKPEKFRIVQEYVIGNQGLEIYRIFNK